MPSCSTQQSSQLTVQLLQGLVKPRGGAVQDLKTALTGVTSDRLVGVTQRRGDMVRRLLPLLEGGRTILVGHSLHQDLAALRLDYEPVIDTALLFSYRWVTEVIIVRSCCAACGQAAGRAVH